MSEATFHCILHLAVYLGEFTYTCGGGHTMTGKILWLFQLAIRDGGGEMALKSKCPPVPLPPPLIRKGGSHSLYIKDKVFWIFQFFGCSKFS